MSRLFGNLIDTEAAALGLRVVSGIRYSVGATFVLSYGQMFDHNVGEYIFACCQKLEIVDELNGWFGVIITDENGFKTEAWLKGPYLKGDYLTIKPAVYLFSEPKLKPVSQAQELQFERILSCS